MAPRSPTTASRISNAPHALPGVDGRSTWARRFKDVCEALMADAGGADVLSEAERSVVRRAATLTVELERLEQSFALAGEADPDALDLYGRASGNLRRLLESLGLGTASGARPITINPTGRTDTDAARRVAFALAMASRQPITDIEAQ